MDERYPDAVFASMGMFIIDEIHFPDRPSQYNVLGGGGTFSILGARMVLGSKQSRKAGWILDIGNDCPEGVLEQVSSWNTGVYVRNDSSRQCTRGWNMYGANDFRSFRYLTPKLRIDVPDIIERPSLLHAKSYHLICSPERCTEILTKLRASRQNEPLIVWEPIPDNCNPESLPKCLDILREVDILSPNAQEAAAFYGIPEPTEKNEIEALAAKFLNRMTKNVHSGVIVRCGALGCYAVNRMGLSKWFPAYHSDQTRVIDPTGGGNTFIGALAAAYVLSKDWQVACIAANAASGAAIEQIGMPKLEDDSWNDLSFADRAARYLSHNHLGVSTEEVMSKLDN